MLNMQDGLDGLDNLRKKFPGRRIKMTTLLTANGFSPTQRIIVDGHHCKLRWVPQLEYYGSQLLAEEIKTELPLSKLKQWRNQIDYLRKR